MIRLTIFHVCEAQAKCKQANEQKTTTKMLKSDIRVGTLDRAPCRSAYSRSRLHVAIILFIGKYAKEYLPSLNLSDEINNK